jgi:chemotaxis regulatin CheY-phosphate phosphatase CheZ
LKKAVPNTTAARANAEQVFSETITLLENSELVTEINNILEAFQNNSDNLDAPDQYLKQRYNDFIKQEISLTKTLNLKRSEIEALINPSFVTTGKVKSE